MRLSTLAEARWILAGLAALAVISLPCQPALAVLWAVAFGFTLLFFRDPQRTIPADPDAVLAAADGTVVEVVTTSEPEVVKAPMQRVAIFLSVFDVHVNRAPVAGEVVYRQHYLGKFLDARNPAATHLNEAQTWAFRNPRATVVVRQITGAIARRIVGWVDVGQTVARGERFGMIRFGSRTEVYLPGQCTVLVKPGDRVRAGETIIARFPPGPPASPPPGPAGRPPPAVAP